MRVTDHIVAGIARVCHEANAAWCRANGDQSQVSWRDAPPWQRDSAIAGVRFHIANPDANDEDSHNSWLEEKRAAGWSWGAVKDADKKEHPCFIQYERLPFVDRFKDTLFRTIVHASIGHG